MLCESILRRKQKILRDIKVSGENCAKLPQMEQGLQGEFEKYSNMIMNRNITFRGGFIHEQDRVSSSNR